MRSILVALSVHAFTATGAIFGLMALIAASNRAWEQAFLWLGLALIVDGVDGTLARAAKVKEVLPRFSGDDLDHVIDYLNYVAVPAFILAQADIVPDFARLPLAALIMLVSLYHFADTQSKTSDGYFVGFPAIWNVVVLYCFIFAFPPFFASCIIAFCALLTFIPLKWVHPVRVKRFRPLTLLAALVWTSAAVSALSKGFPAGLWERSVFLGVGFYLIVMGVTGGSARGAILRS